MNGLGAPAADGRLCTTASNTNTTLATFADPNLTTPLPNPISLNGAGHDRRGRIDGNLFAARSVSIHAVRIRDGQSM
jgi:hypothetical protein